MGFSLIGDSRFGTYLANLERKSPGDAAVALGRFSLAVQSVFAALRSGRLTHREAHQALASQNLLPPRGQPGHHAVKEGLHQADALFLRAEKKARHELVALHGAHRFARSMAPKFTRALVGTPPRTRREPLLKDSELDQELRRFCFATALLVPEAVTTGGPQGRSLSDALESLPSLLFPTEGLASRRALFRVLARMESALDAATSATRMGGDAVQREEAHHFEPLRSHLGFLEGVDARYARKGGFNPATVTQINLSWSELENHASQVLPEEHPFLALVRNEVYWADERASDQQLVWGAERVRLALLAFLPVPGQK